jgi:hypothetical protein
MPVKRLFQIIRRLCQEEHGFVVSTEWLIWVTIVVIVTVVGIQTVRVAVRGVLTHVAVEISTRQHHEFDHQDTSCDSDGDHFGGYSRMVTPNEFDRLFPDLGTRPAPVRAVPATSESGS